MKRSLVISVLVATVLILVLVGTVLAGEGTWTATQRTTYPTYTNNNAPRLHVVGDWIYVIWANNIGKNIYVAKMDLDGNNFSIITTKTLEPPPNVPQLKTLDSAIIDGVIHLVWVNSDNPNAYGLWTGRMNLDGTGWEQEHHENVASFRVLSVRMAVSASKAYYIFTVRVDLTPPTEFYTSSMDLDGNNWSSTARSSVAVSSYNAADVEVVGDKVYYICSLIVGSYEQLWTATTNLDDSGWVAVQRTFDEGRYYSEPRMEISGSKIYYTGWVGDDNAVSGYDEYIFTASMNLNQTNWSHTVRVNTSIYAETCDLVVGSEKVYYLFVAWLAPGWDEIYVYTAEAELDGLGWNTTKRTADTVYSRDVAAVGSASKAYYVWCAEYEETTPQLWTGIFVPLVTAPTPPHWLLRTFPTVIALMGVVGVFMVLQTVNLTTIVSALAIGAVSIIVFQTAVSLTGL